MDTTNILISGVGGQGLVVATQILAEVAFKEGFDIKTSDVIGLSQRGGMVWGSVRFGKKVYSALIPSGEGDVLLAMEKLEALRWANSLKPGATVVLNEECIYPNKVLLEKVEYPVNVKETLEDKGFQVMPVDAKELARESGSIKAANTVLLGKLSRFLPFTERTWIEVIKKNVPAGTEDLNIKAFYLGRSE